MNNENEIDFDFTKSLFEDLEYYVNSYKDINLDALKSKLLNAVAHDGEHADELIANYKYFVSDFDTFMNNFKNEDEDFFKTCEYDKNNVAFKEEICKDFKFFSDPDNIKNYYLVCPKYLENYIYLENKSNLYELRLNDSNYKFYIYKNKVVVKDYKDNKLFEVIFNNGKLITKDNKLNYLLNASTKLNSYIDFEDQMDQIFETRFKLTNKENNEFNYIDYSYYDNAFIYIEDTYILISMDYNENQSFEDFIPTVIYGVASSLLLAKVLKDFKKGLLK